MKPKYHLDNLTDRDTIECSTKELWEKVLEIGFKNNLKWKTGALYTKHGHSDILSHENCLRIKAGVRGDVAFARRKKYNIISAEDFIRDNTETKFKIGDKVKTKKIEHYQSCQGTQKASCISKNYREGTIKNINFDNGHYWFLLTDYGNYIREDGLELIESITNTSDWIENPTWEQLLAAEGWEFETIANISSLNIGLKGRISKNKNSAFINLVQNEIHGNDNSINLYGYKWGYAIQNTNCKSIKIRPYQEKSTFFKDLPIKISSDGFEVEFTLPEKWCIVAKNTEQVSILNAFMHKNCKNYTGYTKSWTIWENSYFHYPQATKNAHSSEVQKRYEEITFEQFQKYVFKEPIMETQPKEWKICWKTKEIFNATVGFAKRKDLEYCRESGLDESGNYLSFSGCFKDSKKSEITLEQFYQFTNQSSSSVQSINNNLNNQSNVNQNNSQNGLKVCGSNFKISGSTPIRGVGLKSNRSKIIIGSNNSYDQKRFSGCKA